MAIYFHQCSMTTGQLVNICGSLHPGYWMYLSLVGNRTDDITMKLWLIEVIFWGVCMLEREEDRLGGREKEGGREKREGEGVRGQWRHGSWKLSQRDASIISCLYKGSERRRRSAPCCDMDSPSHSAVIIDNRASKCILLPGYGQLFLWTENA